MRISIITPSYNQAEFLEQTIRSVLESSPCPDEYFVIDGGSTDNSIEIIKKYQAQLTAWVSEKDKGQADAINKGFRMVNGDIIAWLNSDDYYLPGAIEQVMLAFEKNPQVGLVYGDVLSVDQAGNTFNVQTFKQYALTDLLGFSIISQPAVFFRKAALQKAGLLDMNFHYLLDHHLWLRMAIETPILYIPQTLAAARYHENAKNVAHTAEFGKEANRIIEWMQQTPSFAKLFEQYKNKIYGGANRLNAFYLVDGGNYLMALESYWQAFKYDPIVVIRELHRVLYCILSLVGLKNLRNIYSHLRRFVKKI